MEARPGVTARWDDLPQSMKARVVKKPRQSRTGKGTFRCHACEHETTVYSKAERHADETGHVRIECLPTG